MPEVDLGDVTIAYDVVGEDEGEPIVLVAGCGQPAAAWHIGLAPLLASAGHQVITFDNRGVRPSSSPEAPYSVEQMAQDTLGLLDHLGLDQPVRMAGHSMGGWITETIAAEHPERLISAALMGCANMPTAWEKALTTVERDLAQLDYEMPRLFYAVETLRYLPQRDLQDDAVVSDWLELIADLEPWPQPGRLGQYEACLAWSTDPARGKAWPQITVPCLVLAFEFDTDSPPRLAEAAAGIIPSAAFHEIPGAGHIGIVTHVAQVADALIDWFAAH
jgi:pimeloyl-ACP methyl ester carboxylesterase